MKPYSNDYITSGLPRNIKMDCFLQPFSLKNHVKIAAKKNTKVLGLLEVVGKK